MEEKLEPQLVERMIPKAVELFASMYKGYTVVRFPVNLNNSFYDKKQGRIIEFLFDDYTVLGRYIELNDENEGTVEVFISKDVIQQKI